MHPKSLTWTSFLCPAWTNRRHRRSTDWRLRRWHSAGGCGWGANRCRTYWWGSNWRSPPGWPRWCPHQAHGGRPGWNTLWVEQRDVLWGVHISDLIHLLSCHESVFAVDPSKEATFKVAPSKWEAVDEAELESQGETCSGIRPLPNIWKALTSIHFLSLFTSSAVCVLSLPSSFFISCDNFEMGDVRAARRNEKVGCRFFQYCAPNCQLIHQHQQTVKLRRDAEDSDDDDRSPRSDENQSYFNPIRDESDAKAKMSEMNEEKRTKLREIEVLYRIPQTLPYINICDDVGVHFPFIAPSGEGHEVPGWAGVWEATQKARAEHSGTGRALQGQTTAKGSESGCAPCSIDDTTCRTWNWIRGPFIILPVGKRKGETWTWEREGEERERESWGPAERLEEGQRKGGHAH